MAAIASSAMMAIAIVPHERASVHAQLPPPNPLTAPRALPSPPAPLAAPVQPEGLPSLAIVQPVPTNTPPPSIRAFNCSCYGAGIPTSWMGTVTANGYFAARQSATSACLAYNQRREVVPSPIPPLGIARNVAGFVGAPPLPVGQGANAASVLINSKPGTLNFSTPEQLQRCSVCTCG